MEGPSVPRAGGMGAHPPRPCETQLCQPLPALSPWLRWRRGWDVAVPPRPGGIIAGWGLGDPLCLGQWGVLKEILAEHTPW